MGKESMIGLRDKCCNTSIEKRLKGIVAMEFEVESNGDDGSLSEANTFWPVQHPTEPLEEDRPIICPMPYSSSVLKNNGLQEGRFSADIMRKRSDYSAPRKSGGILEVTMEPPIRVVRKRHHPLGPEYRGGVAGPVRRVPPHNATMSQMLHQFNHFKS
ncbi:uncharacterized protein LOC116024941 [Ipomoea triloba]|uniref:uncharacterized protein LOC116024941 n=1 Tax=Ipomoea triloba TaxID=35885 RepID=UPI00125D4003|nr:uncharacterized protein LOC116024941 [Ipomoea triloba]